MTWRAFVRRVWPGEVSVEVDVNMQVQRLGSRFFDGLRTGSSHVEAT